MSTKCEKTKPQLITKQRPDPVTAENFPPGLPECTLIPIELKPSFQTVNLDSDEECNSTVKSSKKETENIIKYIQTKLKLEMKTVKVSSKTSNIKKTKLNNLENNDLSSNNLQDQGEKHCFLQALHNLTRDLKLNGTNSESIELISLSDDEEKNKLSTPISKSNEECRTYNNTVVCETVSLDGTDSENELLKSVDNAAITFSQTPVPENNNKGFKTASLDGTDLEHLELKVASYTQVQSQTNEIHPNIYINEIKHIKNNNEVSETVRLDGTDSEDEELKLGNESGQSERPNKERKLNTLDDNSNTTHVKKNDEMYKRESLTSTDFEDRVLKLPTEPAQNKSPNKYIKPNTLQNINETISIQKNDEVSETVSLDCIDSEDEKWNLDNESTDNNKTTSVKNKKEVSERGRLDGTDSEDKALKLSNEPPQTESPTKDIKTHQLHNDNETASFTNNEEVSEIVSLDGTDSEDEKLKLDESTGTETPNEKSKLNTLNDNNETTSVTNNYKNSERVCLDCTDIEDKELKLANNPSQTKGLNIKPNSLHSNIKTQSVKNNYEVSETVSLNGTYSEELNLAHGPLQTEDSNKDIKTNMLHNNNETASVKNNDEVSEIVSLGGSDSEDEELKLANDKLTQRENPKNEIKLNTLHNNDETICNKNNDKACKRVNSDSTRNKILISALNKRNLEMSPSHNPKKIIKFNPVPEKNKTICHKNTVEFSETVSLGGTDSEDERLTSLISDDQISKISPSPKKKMKLKPVPKNIDNKQDQNEISETISLDGTDSEDERINSLISRHNSDSSRVINDSDTESSQSKENHSKNEQIKEKIYELELENSKPSTSKTKDANSERKYLLKIFLKLVKHQIRGSQFEEGLTKKFQTVEKYYHKCGENVKDNSFLDLIKENITKTEDGSASTAVIAFHKVFERLKMISGKATVEVEEAYIPVLKKLEKTIKLLTRKIKQLEEAEIDFEDDEDSAYIQADKYQKRLNKVYAKYCKYIKKNPYSGRLTHDKINFCNSSYNEINLAINRKYKNSLKFPSYYELERYIANVAKKENLKLLESDIKYESSKCFKELGRILQKRRKTELYDCHVDFIENSEDPASKDRYLENTLKKNFMEGQVKIEKLCQKYSAKQEHEEDKVSSAASEYSDFSEDQQPS